MKPLFSIFLFALGALIASACGNKSAETTAPDAPAEAASATLAAADVAADADTLFMYVADQVAMGPRIPGTPGHDRCVDYITARLKRAGAVVTVQDTLFAPAGSSMSPQRVRNITGSFNVGAPRHVLLLAHYDTRPWADEEADAALHNTPIDGANDGGSGVAVLLEIARLMRNLPNNLEVELLFVDAEDAGNHNDDLSWCVGSQAWADAFDPASRRMPDYAILLDMVGARGACFHREYFSERYARSVNNLVWDAARRTGYANRFVDKVGGALNDDHIHIMSVGIPAIDIVESQNPETGSFNPSWHTLSDNLDNIDPATLKMTADVVINSIFH